ncbi:MAG: hypothetical protein FE78DRAFT_545242 [Acidomyces sp. 'richmondensis']|nr:MAG: hypothetical protein FE78DRAFT_545242 [Acidomyces sp. 'richmondensis']
MWSSSSSLFDRLPERPPTPPRDVAKAVNDAISFLDDSNEVERALNTSHSTTGVSCSPPDGTPLSSLPQPTGSVSKTVGFCTVPTYHQIVRSGEDGWWDSQPRKCSPSKRGAVPLKSILKQSNVPAPLTPEDLETKIFCCSPHEPGSFAKMLQSVIHQLASSSISARLDAYMALNGALRAYEGTPDPQLLASKMRCFMQYLARDVVWKNSNNVLDIKIITQALKLITHILFDAKLSAAIDNDFRAFIADRSIVVIETSDMPKALIKPHLFILAQQRFEATIMTNSRADRIIAALRTIEERCSGNSVFATRLAIYQRLLEQSPSVMLNRMRDWLEQVFHGMLSSLKDVRHRAIEVCTEAGLRLGIQPRASKSLMDLFESPVDDGQNYCDFLAHRLTIMVRDKDIGVDAPRIWSAAILFFRNKRFPLEKWPNLKSWLLIIQKCLNSPDSNISSQSHIAWNKLVFTVMPDASTSKNMFDMLKIPITNAMDKRGSDRHSKIMRNSALCSYYNLLHYSLRPGLSFEELDRGWDAYVEPVLKGMLRANSGRHIACGVLYGLFTASSGLWNVNAANESMAMKRGDLPKLDSKWIRSRLAKILRLLGPMVFSSMRQPDARMDLRITWEALMHCIAEACSQEVKTTNELKEALASLINQFKKFWLDGSTQVDELGDGIFFDSFGMLIETSVQSIGPGAFTEDFLTKTRDDHIEATLSPSHRSSKHSSTPQSAFVILFGLLYSYTNAWHDIETLSSRLLQLLLSSRASPPAKIELLRRCLHVWSSLYANEAGPNVVANLWTRVAKVTIPLLRAPLSDGDSRDSQAFGLKVRNASVILSDGLKYTSTNQAALDGAKALYEEIFNAAKDSAGVAGTVIAAVEPVAMAILDAGASINMASRISLANYIVKASIWPNTKQELEEARRNILGVGLAPLRTTVFDPYDHLYKLIVDTLKALYNELPSSNPEVLGQALEFLGSTMGWLRSCPISLVINALRRVQEGFALWIADVARRTNSNANISDAVQLTWQELLRLLNMQPEKSNTLLKVLEPLLVAAFSSPHKQIVNETILFWNESFGCQDTIEYPIGLLPVLLARSDETDIILPGLPNDHVHESIQLPVFYESQLPYLSETSSTGQPNLAEMSWLPSTAPAMLVPNPDCLTSTRPCSSAVAVVTRSAADSPYIKLPHDDSKIHCAMVEPSPGNGQDSRMLTEHQEEVTARQNEENRIFGDFLSSPVVKPQVGAKGVSKRLDFGSERTAMEDNGHAGTPQALLDMEVPMSDDIPSSPTPSSNKDIEPAQIELDDEVNDMDIPSSPPRQTNEENQISVLSLDGAEATIEDVKLGSCDYDRDTKLQVSSVAHERSEISQFADFNLPSDSLLPNQQLELEEEAAAAAHTQILARGQCINLDASLANPGTPAQNVQQRADTDDGQSVDITRDQGADEVTRIEHSLSDSGLKDDDHNQQSSRGQQSQGVRRKRKRGCSAVRTTSKRKNESPLKGFFSFWRPSHQEIEDEEVGEEIVVASSQMSSSPTSARERDVRTKIRAATSSQVAQDNNSTSAGEEQLPAAVPLAKHSRGKPKSLATPTPEQSQDRPLSSRSLKRKASAMKAEKVEPAASFIKDTPAAPLKMRKRREGQDVKSAALEEETKQKRSTRRSLSGVVLPKPTSSLEEDGSALNPSTPDKQVTKEEQGNMVAHCARAIATPRSILGRLRGILPDLRKLILGVQEEREFDDVLFEIRKEVHEASRRGRE